MKQNFLHIKKRWKKCTALANGEYVGKQSLDPNAKSIPLTPPVGKPYILFKQVCENDPHRKDKD